MFHPLTLETVMESPARSHVLGRYRVSAASRRRPWDYKVYLRAAVDIASLPPGSRILLEAVIDDRYTCAGIVIRPAPGGRGARWAGGGVGGLNYGSSSGDRVHVAAKEFIRLQGLRRGTHTLRYRVRTTGGARFRRAAFDPKSGIFATRQPVEPLRILPSTSRSSSTVRVRVRNVGRIRIVGARLAASWLPPSQTVAMPPLGAGRSTVADLPSGCPSGSEDRVGEVLATSNRGSAMARVELSACAEESSH